MSKFPNLRNAPITEAMIDLRVELPPDFDLDVIRRLHAKLRSNYPNIQERFRLQSEFQFEVGKDSKSSAVQTQDGYTFTSKDKLNVLQAHTSGVTFSRLKPYKNWESFYKEAKRVWNIFSEGTHPVSITRIATRFVNRLELPLPVRDLKDFLTSVPDIPPRLPQQLISFVSRVVIPEPRLGALAVITQASQDRNEDDSKDIAPVLLDIDVFKESHFEPDGKQAWTMLDDFREVKNRIFFESITEKLENIYK